MARAGAEWYTAGDEPFCAPICDQIEKVQNRKFECSNGTEMGSECKFYCNDRFQVRGASSAKCVQNTETENGVGWTATFPVCEPMCNAVPRIQLGCPNLFKIPKNNFIKKLIEILSENCKPKLQFL